MSFFETFKCYRNNGQIYCYDACRSVNRTRRSRVLDYTSPAIVINLILTVLFQVSYSLQTILGNPNSAFIRFMELMWSENKVNCIWFFYSHLVLDNRIARRKESFCKGLAFSNRSATSFCFQIRDAIQADLNRRMRLSPANRGSHKLVRRSQIRGYQCRSRNISYTAGAKVGKYVVRKHIV